MGNALVQLATITLTGNDSQIIFASIPGSHRDLYLTVDPIAAGSAFAYPSIRLNGDAGYNYPTIVLQAGTPVSASQSFNRIGVGGDSRTSAGHSVTYEIFDYAQTTKNKMVYYRENYYGEYVADSCSRWASNSAVTSITVFFEGGENFAAGSTFSLFGREG